MITVTNLAKGFGAQTLFEGASLQLDAGSRYGVVGANGSGKSTLLRILTGQEEASAGEVSVPRKLRVGILTQDHFRYEAVPILHVVMMGIGELWTAMAEKEALLAQARAGAPFDEARYAELEDVVLRHDGYALEARAGEVLEGLNIPSALHRQPLSVLSGGFKLRVLLAQTLASKPDALLLDEPTNHLDILSVRWLETYLESFPGCTVVVSHDHRFLNNVCTHIIDVDYERVTLYRGNYDAFVLQKRADREVMEAEIAKREKEIESQEAFIRHFRARPSKARQAQSKVKRVEKIVIPKLPQSSRRYPSFRFEACRPSGRTVVKVEGLAKAFGDKPVLTDVTLEVNRGDRLAILGPNGIGKSTLFKILMGQLAPDAGQVEWGYETHPGYFAQDHRELLDSGKDTVLTWLWKACPGEPIGYPLGRLARVLFSREDADKKLTALSGGEGARLVFARLNVTKPNVLVLDEPTNHLDLEGIEALAEGLEGYDGTILLVSHDRWFVSRLATRILELRPGGMVDFRGTYEEYLEHCGDDHLDARMVVERARRERRQARLLRATGVAAPAPSPSAKGAERDPDSRHAFGRKQGGKTQEAEPAERRSRPATPPGKSTLSAAARAALDAALQGEKPPEPSPPPVSRRRRRRRGGGGRD